MQYCTLRLWNCIYLYIHKIQFTKKMLKKECHQWTAHRQLEGPSMSKRVWLNGFRVHAFSYLPLFTFLISCLYPALFPIAPTKDAPRAAQTVTCRLEQKRVSTCSYSKNCVDNACTVAVIVQQWVMQFRDTITLEIARLLIFRYESLWTCY